MSEFNPNRYGPAIVELLQHSRLMPLGPGEPVAAVKALLSSHTPESIVAPAIVRDPSMASACLAGLWLYFDYLDESHRISQEFATPTGSYWHALMHRREPDFPNAKYWFRRVGNHPVLRELAGVVTEMEGTGDLPTMGRAWDPLAFVDLCESVCAGRSSLAKLCQEIQQREWELLFDYCHRNSI